MTDFQEISFYKIPMNTYVHKLRILYFSHICEASCHFKAVLFVNLENHTSNHSIAPQSYPSTLSALHVIYPFYLKTSEVSKQFPYSKKINGEIRK